MKIIKKGLVIFFCTLVIISGYSIGVALDKNQPDTQTLSDFHFKDSALYTLNEESEDDKPVSTLTLDILDQQQPVDSGISWSVSENGYYAQSFKPTLSQLTKVQIILFKKGTPDGIRISIRSSLTGPDLTLKYLSASSISSTASWHDFDVPDISVTPGSTYYIVWDPIGVPDFNNNFFWHVGTPNPYANGNAWSYLGSSWALHDPVQSPDPDFCFKTYGVSGGSNDPPNKPTTPSGQTTGLINENLHYESYISDPDGDGMEVYFDWGDGTHTGWVGILTNGTVGNYKMWSAPGTYQVRVKTRDTPHLEESLWSDSLSVIITDGTNVAPGKPSTPSGPTSGKTGISYTYSSMTTDADGDEIYYFFDWADGTDSGWIGPFTSGDECQESHIWTAQGTYTVKVKAKDSNDAESVWSESLTISMPKMRSIGSVSETLLRMLERFSFLQSLLFL